MNQQTYLKALEFALHLLKECPTETIAKLLMIEFFLPPDEVYDKRLHELRFWQKVAFNIARSHLND